ncbi:hypothetical protein ATO13_22051 [Stappia sp. 22II-S9-Z10]|nr:hypothetical protein ATO13_22051 [Stappia sp. 22II-S9-Z10]
MAQQKIGLMSGTVTELHPAPAGLMSGGELPHGSTDVWAIQALSSSRKAHFWRRVGHGYQRVCGNEYDVAPAFLRNGQNPLFAPGDFPKCKRCMDTLRKASQEARI